MIENDGVRSGWRFSLCNVGGGRSTLNKVQTVCYFKQLSTLSTSTAIEGLLSLVSVCFVEAERIMVVL